MACNHVNYFTNAQKNPRPSIICPVTSQKRTFVRRRDAQAIERLLRIANRRRPKSGEKRCHYRMEFQDLLGSVAPVITVYSYAGLKLLAQAYGATADQASAVCRCGLALLIREI
jgi:hypothetical protein